jgi:hypothetical protein
MTNVQGPKNVQAPSVNGFAGLGWVTGSGRAGGSWVAVAVNGALRGGVAGKSNLRGGAFGG